MLNIDSPKEANQFDSCCQEEIYDYYSHVSMSYYAEFPPILPSKLKNIFEVQCG